MAFRNVAASLTLDITDYRAKLNAVAADTRRVAAQLNGSMSATGFDKAEGDVARLDRSLTGVPEHARQAGASSQMAFAGFGAELGQLDDQAGRVARSQGQISEAAAEASRRAGGAYRAIGTEANSAAASARTSLGGLTSVTTTVGSSASTAALAEREIGLAASQSSAEAKTALAGLAGAHAPIVVGATEAALAEALIGEASLRSLTQVERSAIAMAAAEGRISEAAAASALKRVASSEQVAAAILRESEAMAVRDAQARASTVFGRGPGPTPPGTRGSTGGPTGRAGTVLTSGSMALEGSARGMITVGAGLVLGFGLAERAVMSFDKELSNVAAVSDATGSRLGGLRTSAIEAGKATSFSASEAAKAEAELARAGLTVEEITGGGLRAALDLAAAGQLDLGEAATTAATAMNQFHLTGADSGRVADTLAAGANKSAADVRELAQSLGQSGQVAAQFGLGLEDTVATLSLFADSGLKGSDAGTSLRTMLLRLANPADESKRAMRDLGLSAYDASGQFVGMENLSGQLQTKLAGLTQQQRDQALATIFGSDSIRAANVLMKAGAAGFDEYATAVTDQGAASRFASAQMDNLAGDVERLGGSIETALIQGGSGATPVLRGMAQAAEGAVNTFASLPAPVTGAATALAGAGGAALLVGGSVSFLKPKVDAARTSLVELGKGGEIANRGLGLLGRAAGLAASLFAVAAAADFLNTKIADLTHNDVSVSKLTNSLLDLDASMKNGPGFKASGELAEKYGAQLQGLGKDLLEFKNANQGGGRQGNFLAGFGATLGRQSPQYKNTLKDLDAMDKALAGMFRAGGPQADAAKRIFSGLSGDAKRLGLDQGTLKKAFNDTTDAMAEQDAKGKVDKLTKQDQAGATGLVADETKKLNDEVDDLAQKAGLAGPVLRDMMDPEAAKEFLKTLTDVGEKVKAAFLGDFDVTTHVEADPLKIKDAQAQIAELRKQGKPIPIELGNISQGPLDQLKRFYEEANRKGKEFTDNTRRAFELGFDPQLIQRLMLQGPEKAGPLLAALVSQSGASMVGLVNIQEEQLRRQSMEVERLATESMIKQVVVQQLTTKAVTDNATKRTTSLTDAINVQKVILVGGTSTTYADVARITGLKTAEIQAIVNEWGLKLFAGIDGVISSMYLRDASGHTMPGPGGRGTAVPGGGIGYALGGMQYDTRGDVANAHQPEFGRSGTVPRLWLEPEIGGETYLSHKNDHRRPANIRYLQKTAELFGMVAMPMQEFRARLDRDTVRLADGAVMARHEWVGGPSPSPRPALDRLRERVVERFAGGGMRESRTERVASREMLQDGVVGRVSDRADRSVEAVRPRVGQFLHLRGGESGVREHRLQPVVPPMVARAVATPDQPHLSEPGPHFAHRLAQVGGAPGRADLVDRGLHPTPLSAAGPLPQAAPDPSFARGGIVHRLLTFAVGGTLERGLGPERDVHHLVGFSPGVDRRDDPRVRREILALPKADVHQVAGLQVGHGDRTGHRGELHAPTVRRLAAGDLLPAVPLKELAPYNVGPTGAGKRALDATVVMRDIAVTQINQRERDVQHLRDVLAMQAAASVPAGAGGRGRDGAMGAEVQLWINAGLDLTRKPRGWLPTLLHLVGRESGGNPRAVNPITVLGQHATGLFQMLPSTFQSNMVPGFSNIFDPVSNAASALNYISRTYGSPDRIPHLYDAAYQGYARGGIILGPLMRLAAQHFASGGVVERGSARRAKHREVGMKRHAGVERFAGHDLAAPAAVGRAPQPSGRLRHVERGRHDPVAVRHSDVLVGGRTQHAALAPQRLAHAPHPMVLAFAEGAAIERLADGGVVPRSAGSVGATRAQTTTFEAHQAGALRDRDARGVVLAGQVPTSGVVREHAGARAKVAIRGADHLGDGRRTVVHGDVGRAAALQGLPLLPLRHAPNVAVHFASGGIVDRRIQLAQSRHELIHQPGVLGRPVVDGEVTRSVRLGDGRAVPHRHERALVRGVDAVGHGSHAPTVRRLAVGGLLPRGASQIDRRHLPRDLLVPGNLNLDRRPSIPRRDGSVTTLAPVVHAEGPRNQRRYIVLPTALGSKVRSHAEAVDWYHRTFEHLGIFRRESTARSYASQLHRQLESRLRAQETTTGTTTPGRGLTGRRFADGGVFRAVAWPGLADEGLGYTTLPTEHLNPDVVRIRRQSGARLPKGFEYGGEWYRGPQVPGWNPRDAGKRRVGEALAAADYDRRAKAAHDHAHYSGWRTPQAEVRAVNAHKAQLEAERAAYEASRSGDPAAAAAAQRRAMEAKRDAWLASQPDVVQVSTLPKGQERMTVGPPPSPIYGSPGWGVDIGRWAIGMADGGVIPARSGARAMEETRLRPFAARGFQLDPSRHDVVRGGRDRTLVGGEHPLRISDLATMRLPSFAGGGTVPGPPGAPQVILAHGGEHVVQPVRAVGAGASGGPVHFEVHVPLHIQGPLAAGVTPADVERTVKETVGPEVTKAAERFMAGVKSV